MDSKKLFILVLATVLVGALGAIGYYFYSKGGVQDIVVLESNEKLTITLTKDGFSPKLATIKKGTLVTFKTTNGKFFWPASNPHPTHTAYPEFDPKDAIPADKTWDFKFEKTGVWGYHDHLAPYYTGTIKVE